VCQERERAGVTERGKGEERDEGRESGERETERKREMERERDRERETEREKEGEKEYAQTYNLCAQQLTTILSHSFSLPLPLSDALAPT
jgi:hypothetical protein